MAMPSCSRLLTHWARRACSRADWIAGSSNAIKTAMIPTTINKLDQREGPGRLMDRLPWASEFIRADDFAVGAVGQQAEDSPD